MLSKFFKLFVVSALTFYSNSVFAQPVASLPEDVSPMEPPTIAECPDTADVLLSNLKHPTKGDAILLYNVTHHQPLWGAVSRVHDTIIAKNDGWYALYSQRSAGQMYDSGDKQKNESFFLTVHNGYNKEGRPASGNCLGYQIAKDVTIDEFDSTSRLMYLGTFYFKAGPNDVTYNQFCDLYNQMGDLDSSCEYLHETSRYTGDYTLNGNTFPASFTSRCDEPSYFDDSGNVVGAFHRGVNSVHAIVPGFCAIPKTLTTPSLGRLKTPSLDENFESMSLGQTLDSNSWLQTGSGSIHDLSEEAAFRKYLKDTGSPYYEANRSITEKKWDLVTPAPPGTFSTEANGSEMVYNCDPSGGGNYFAVHVGDQRDRQGLFSAISTSVWRNYEYTGRFRINDSHTTNPNKRVNGIVRILFHSQAPTTNSMNHISIENGESRRILDRYNLAWRRAPDWVKNEGSTSKRSFKTNTFYKFKIRATTLDKGNRFESKIWEEGTAEPTNIDRRLETWKGGSPGGGFVGFGCANSLYPVSGWNDMESVSFDDLKVISIAP